MAASQEAVQRRMRLNLYDSSYSAEDDTFLALLQTNAELSILPLADIISNTSALVWRVSCLVVYMVTYFMIWRHEISRAALTGLILAAALLIAGIRSFSRTEVRAYRCQRRANIVKPLIFVFLLLAATPILKTLTETYSDDTVVMMACIFIFVHLLSHDYKVCDPRATDLPSVLSMNAAISAAILLGSRLASVGLIFQFLSWSVMVLVIIPRARRRLQVRTSPCAFTTCTIAVALGSVALLAMAVSGRSAVAYAVCLLFVWMACPLLYFRCQRRKRVISGPWDVATVKPLETIGQERET